MAVLTITGVPVSGAKYTVTTASSTDWASVSNSTYFFDLTDKLVYYKTSTGAITYGFNSSANRILRINNQIGTSYTLAIDDFNSDTITIMDNASANTVTIPPSVFPIGAQLLVAQEGLGQTSFVAGAGVTINAVGLSISSRYKSVALIQVALNEWDAYGTLDASLYTARTTAFATATAIADTTILGALNTFDLGLISNGLDTKMKAVYPFVGSTATTQKFNFMDARDLDVAFRIQFNGGWTHSSTGAKGNGTNTYMNTFLNQFNNFTDWKKSSIGIYSRTNESGLFLEGNYGFSDSNFALYPRLADGRLIFQAGAPLASASVADSLGFLVGSSISGSDRRVYKNGVKLATNTETNTFGVLTGLNTYFGALNGSGTATYISNKDYALAFLGESLTDADQSALYTLTQTMQTSLSRQI
jgi:3D (Asp-Asp-Asp) domain-containing protein